MPWDEVLNLLEVKEREKEREIKRLSDEKEREIKRISDEKEKNFKLILDEKEREIERIMKLKDDLLKQKDKEVLQAKGSMTCRGILEYLASQIRRERGLKMRTPISDVLASIEDQEQVSPTAQSLLDAHARCKVDIAPNDFYRKLYRELCKDIHGASWSGPSVKMTFTEDSQPEYRCVMVALVQDVLDWYID